MALSTHGGSATLVAKYIGKFVISSVLLIKALSSLPSRAASEAKGIGKFVTLGVVMIKSRQKKATKAGRRGIFGRVAIEGDYCGVSGEVHRHVSRRRSAGGPAAQG